MEKIERKEGLKMGKRKFQICFTPSNEFRIRLENYMSVHHIDVVSEAMTKICDNWITLQKDNLTLKTLLSGNLPPEALSIKDKIKKFDCLKGLKIENDQQLEKECKKCSSENLELFNRCTDKKEL